MVGLLLPRQSGVQRTRSAGFDKQNPTKTYHALRWPYYASTYHVYTGIVSLRLPSTCIGRPWTWKTASQGAVNPDSPWPTRRDNTSRLGIRTCLVVHTAGLLEEEKSYYSAIAYPVGLCAGKELWSLHP